MSTCTVTLTSVPTSEIIKERYRRNREAENKTMITQNRKYREEYREEYRDYRDHRGENSQLLLTVASLRMEVAELRRENKSLAARNEDLENRMKIAEITKLFRNLAPISVYRRYFLGSYQGHILRELIARYSNADVPGEIDLRVLKHNLNRIGAECMTGVLRTFDGAEICFRGG